VVTLRRAKVMRGARPAKALVMMAAAKPLVLAAEGEAAELITRAEAGFVVPPEAPLALARAIRSLLSDPGAARQMGLNGRAFIQENLEWNLLVRNWIFQLTGVSTPSAKTDESKGQKSHDRVATVRAAV
jgi:putative colanic acid biosynthesis glycosyltransferase WcaI